LTGFKFLPQCLKPSLQLFSHDFLFPSRKSEDGFVAYRHILCDNPLLVLFQLGSKLVTGAATQGPKKPEVPAALDIRQRIA
jgi:hypothetical protein